MRYSKKLLLCASLSILLSACAGDQKEPANAEELYNKAYTQLEDTSYNKAAKSFEQVELEYPYSKWAVKAKIMSAYAYYKDGAYDDADEIATVGAALSGGIGKLGDVATRGVTKRSARMTGAKELREADKLVASATDDTRKQMAKNAQAMNQAIADATKDVAKEFKISKPSIKKATAEVKKAADDWLNTDFQAAKSERISRADAKRSVREIVKNNSKKSD